MSNNDREIAAIKQLLKITKLKLRDLFLVAFIDMTMKTDKLRNKCSSVKRELNENVLRQMNALNRTECIQFNNADKSLQESTNQNCVILLDEPRRRISLFTNNFVLLKNLLLLVSFQRRI